MIYITRAAGATIADDRTMPQRRARLARGRVQPLQDPRASRSMLSASRGIRRSGSWRPRWNADHAEKAAMRRRCIWSSWRRGERSRLMFGCIRMRRG